MPPSSRADSLHTLTSPRTATLTSGAKPPPCGRTWIAPPSTLNSKRKPLTGRMVTPRASHGPSTSRDLPTGSGSSQLATRATWITPCLASHSKVQTAKFRASHNPRPSRPTTGTVTTATCGTCTTLLVDPRISKTPIALTPLTGPISTASSEDLLFIRLKNLYLQAQLLL